MDTNDLAKQVQDRADELLDQEESVELDSDFVRECIANNVRGDGCLYAAMNRNKCLRNNTPTKDKEWYWWADHVWEKDNFEKTKNAVEPCALEYKKISDSLAKEIEEEGIEDKKHSDFWKVAYKKKVDSRIDRLRDAGAEKALGWSTVVDPSMACLEEDFDNHPWLLPCENGVIDLRTRALTTGRPEDRLTRAIKVAYDPHADYELWCTTIEEICDGDKELAAFLKRSFGCAITGLSREQYIWVFTGPGRNGKGVLFNMISKVMGPYYHEINRGMILEQRNEPAPNAASEHKYSLFRKRIIVGAETNQGQKIDAGAVKGLTGEDIINCRRNFMGEINFLPTHNLFLHTNHIPYGLTKDFSLVKRLIRIEFPNMYVDDVEFEKKKNPPKADRFKQKNGELKEKLQEQLPGILRWLVEGCAEWQERGLDPPQSIKDAVAKLQFEEDYIGRFLEDCLTLHKDQPDLRLSCKEMYTVFKWWRSENLDTQSNKIPAMKTINKEIRERGHKVEGVGGVTYIFSHSINLNVVQAVAKYTANEQ